MAKESFYRLPVEKQKRIIQCAINQFAKYGYDNCSMQSIASCANIAKGSIYTYFGSKKMLFMHIIDMCINMKLELLSKTLTDYSNITDFFEFFHTVISSSIRFALQYPDLFKIFQDLQKNAPEDIKKEFNQKAQNFSLPFSKLMFQKAQSTCQIRDNIDLDLITYIFPNLIRNFGEYIISFDPNLSFEKCETYARQFIDVIKYGLCRRGL